MSNKITWEKVYQDFKNKHPNIARTMVDRYHPYDFGVIKIYLKDRTECLYNYETKRLEIIKD